MTSTEVLKHEHQIILLVLRGAEREVQSIAATENIHPDKVEQMVDFFRAFADRCHHAKEENLLFVRMQEKGMPVEHGPIAVMLAEHREGRRLVKAVADALPRAKAGDADAIAVVSENLSGYVELLRAHIAKEDNVLYPMADRLFTPQDQHALVEAFEKVEREEMGEGTHEKYHQLAHELGENS